MSLDFYAVSINMSLFSPELTYPFLREDLVVMVFQYIWRKSLEVFFPTVVVVVGYVDIGLEIIIRLASMLWMCLVSGGIMGVISLCNDRGG